MTPHRIRLTDAVVRRLVPDECKRLVYWDDDQKGLALTLQPSGQRSYKLVYRLNGRVRWFHIGDARAIRATAARQLARTKMAEVIQGVDIQGQRTEKRRVGTFRELEERYRDEYASRRNKSWKQAAFLARRFLLPVLGARPVTDISRSEIRAIHRRITSDGKPILANQILASASAIFSWAIREEVVKLASNPCIGVEKNPRKARERILSDDEISIFWPSAVSRGQTRAAALRMILLTGQRPGEVIHMRHDQIGDDGWWSMPGQPDEAKGWPGTKNGRDHRIWLSEPARFILKQQRDNGSPFVFAETKGKGKGRPFLGLSPDMRHISKDLGFEPAVTAHDLRRTHGTMITRLGFGRDAMNRLQNHVEGGIADVYDRHSYEAENKAIQEAVARHIMGCVQQPQAAVA